jgi:reductive dehalogenase
MLSLFSARRRPLHLGRYPMEKLPRRARPTTHIGDKVQRVPKRADGFVRAFKGDFGAVAEREIRRFITKNPLNAAIGHLHWKQVPIHRGEAAPEKAPLPNDSAAITRHIKALCHFLDADMVGVCEMPDWAWYSHDLKGQPIEARHKYAVVIVIDQGFDTMEGSSGDDWISGAQSYRAYLKGSTVATIVADYIRRLGYPAQSHSNADGDVLQIPLMLLAGLGEMSRIGELVLNPFIGPRHKTAIITTDLPLEPDKPIDFNLQHFCDKCRKCARECPAQAIPYGDKVLYNDYELWKPDIEKCTKYRVTNLKGSACGRCMKMCPWNKEGLLQHRLAMWAAIKWKWTHRFLIWLDDKLGYGRRNPVKKWWWDHEIRDGRVERAEAANARDLHFDRQDTDDRKKRAFYDLDQLPTEATRDKHPPKRAEGLAARAAGIARLKEVKRRLGLG